MLYRHFRWRWTALTAALGVAFVAACSQQVGYDDTPFLPDQKWRVHDSRRPQPPIVNPGPPPSDAVVLFDGTDLSQWAVREEGRIVDAKWKVENGYMEVVPMTGSIFTREKFGDCQLHIEWASPSEVKGAGQGRGNSGVYLMGRYEIQVLDSWQNPTYADGMAASIYGQFPPLVNASRRPGEWQTYDIIFEAPRFDGGKLVKPAYVTLLHNGVVVHHRTEIIGAVAHRAVGKYTPHDPEESLSLQNYNLPVRYRNIWIRRLAGYDQR